MRGLQRRVFGGYSIIARLPTAVHDRTVALTLTARAAEVTYWTAAMMAKALGISVSSVKRMQFSRQRMHH